VEVVLDGAEQGVRFCREKLALSPQELNPEPFITGNDLIRIGLKPGPKFKSVLQTVRNAQLLHQIHSREEAIELVRHLHESQ
jgi:hypothetical protein